MRLILLHAAVGWLALCTISCATNQVNSVRSESFEGNLERIYILIDHRDLGEADRSRVEAGMSGELQLMLGSRKIDTRISKAKPMPKTLSLESAPRVDLDDIVAFDPDAVLTIFAVRATYGWSDWILKLDYEAEVNVVGAESPVWRGEFSRDGQRPSEDYGKEIARLIVNRLESDGLIAKPSFVVR